MPNKRRLRAILSVFTVFALPLFALAQEESRSQREGPDVQAEAQEVPGGLEPEPAEDFEADEHLSATDVLKRTLRKRSKGLAL